MLWRMAAAYSTLSSLSASLPVLISVYFLSALLPTLVEAQNRSDEVLALLDVKGQLENRAGYYFFEGYFNTWNESDKTPCAWVGVTCSFNFTVEELDLSGLGIGAIPTLEPLSVLRDFRRLDLSSNYLGGPGDGLDTVSTLTGLTWLDVSQNELVGEIPASIAECSRLRFLSLEHNQLNGTIPSTLGDLKDLQFLLLADNQLSGLLPKELGELTNLVIVDLSNNLLTGSIPALLNSTFLLSLKLDNNSFTQFDNSWFSTGSQGPQILSISLNQLEGVLPSIINISELELFNLSSNQLSGPLPSFSLAYDMISSFTLDFSQNNFTGEIPIDFLPLVSPGAGCVISYLNLSYNLLTGNVPLDGTLPYCIIYLDLSYNNLSGLSLNSNSSRNSFIEVDNLWVGNNRLSGDIVEFLLGPISTQDLRMENTLLVGDLSSLAAMNISQSSGFPNSLDLSNNKLHWSISEAIPDPITATLLTLTTISQMTEFWVGGNNFSGTPLPSACFVNLLNSSQLRVLDFSNSHLEGQILGKAFNSSCLPTLSFLNLSSNDITGSVPESIFILPSLEVLNFSYNHLSGPLPYLLSTSTPRSTLYNPSVFYGNKGLCGYPLDLCPEVALQARGVQWWVLLIIISGCVIIALGSCLVATWRWKVYHKRHQQDADLIKALLQRESTTLLSLGELKKATQNFCASAKIGEGGFGTVYKGKLSNGTIVAIKKSKRQGGEGDKGQFLNEVRILSQVNHRSLVKLLGCCMENKIALLVFEFISNGTLQEHLRGKHGGIVLTWEQRLKIAVQTADALNYLHSGAMYPIYHRDVKPANILLDNSLNAKVADFGISRLAPLDVTHVSTVPLQGTIGYIDPEYYTTCKLTDKSDVYSFGVVLLELISAKSALDFHRGGDETSLVNFSRPYIEREDLSGLIDPALSHTYNDLVGNGRDSMMRIGTLALKCLAMPSKARPTMREVLTELESLFAELNSPSEEHLEELITNDDNEDLQPDHKVLLSHVSSENSSSFVMESNASGIIEMSNFSGPPATRFRSRSMEGQ